MDASNSTTFNHLPPEMKKAILKRCTTKDLLACRGVNQQLQDIVEELLSQRSRFWKEGFQNFQQFLLSMTGTRLGSVEDIRRFTLEMGNSENSSFVNETLIFLPSVLNEARNILFYSEFEQFVTEFGSKIKRLVYCFINYEEKKVDGFKQLQNICQLRNLKSLAVCQLVTGRGYKPFSDVSDLITDMEERLKETEFPEGLKELLVFPDSGVDAYPARCPLANVFINLKPFMDSVTHLQLSLNFCSDNNFDPTWERKIICPKLEAIKLFKPTPEVIMFFCRPNAVPLKEICLEVDGGLMQFSNGKIFQFLLNQMETHGASLESLYLAFYGSDLSRTEYRAESRNSHWRNSTPFNFPNKFPRLNKFAMFVVRMDLKLNVILSADVNRSTNLERLALLSNYLYDFRVWFLDKRGRLLPHCPFSFTYFDIPQELMEEIFGNRIGAIKQIMSIEIDDLSQHLFCVPPNTFRFSLV